MKLGLSALLLLAVVVLACASPPPPKPAPLTLADLARRNEPWSLEHSDWLGANCTFIEAAFADFPPAPATGGNVLLTIAYTATGADRWALYDCAQRPPWPRQDLEWVNKQYQKLGAEKGFRCEKAAIGLEPSNVELVTQGTGRTLGADDFILFETRLRSQVMTSDRNWHHHRRLTGDKPSVVSEGTRVQSAPDALAATQLLHRSCAAQQKCSAAALAKMTTVGTVVRLNCGTDEMQYTLRDAGDSAFVTKQLGLTQ